MGLMSCQAPLYAVEFQDESIHWGIKGRQRRGYQSRQVCEGQGPSYVVQTLLYLTPEKWEPRGVSWELDRPPVPTENVVVHRGSLAGAQVGGFACTVCESWLQHCR